MQSERRNPSRKARPPEHFGLEQEPAVAAKPRKTVEFDLKKLMEVKSETRKQQNNRVLYILVYGVLVAHYCGPKRTVYDPKMSGLRSS